MRRGGLRWKLALLCTAIVCALACAAPGTALSGGTRFRVAFGSRSAASVLRHRRLAVRLAGPRGSRVIVSVMVNGTLPRRKGRRVVTARASSRQRRRARIGRRGRVTVEVALDGKSRRLLRSALARCARVTVTISAGGTRRRSALSLPRSCRNRHSAGLPQTAAGGFPIVRVPGGGGTPAAFRAGAAVADFSPPQATTSDAAECDPTHALSRSWAFDEPYQDTNGNGHYDGPGESEPNGTASSGEPYVDCNHNGRWDGNLLGGGASTPRFYDKVADPVGARALALSNGQQTIAVEVVDQEGLFNVYQQQIRDKVAADGYHLDGIFISATHDESAPDSLGLGGVSAATSGVNDYFIAYLVQQGAAAIERAYDAMRPATVRYSEVLEPANFRQCWSSYPFVDDQHVPVLQAVGDDGHTIATLASVSQHAETLGFNGGEQANWVSSDWPNFFRASLEQHFGGVGIEMAGAVGSVESPEVYPSAISRTPEQTLDASHPAGCRTLFTAGGQQDLPGTQHVPLGYTGETEAFGQQLAQPIERALDAGSYYNSTTNTLWGERANICVPLDNALFSAAATAGVFAHRPGYNSDCSVESPVAPNGSTSGTALQSQVAAFRIGDGEFLSIPGEVFPFTYLRGFQGPQDMQDPSKALPQWLLPHMHTPFRFVDGLAEDMIGYIFPQGNAVGIPSQSNPSTNDVDRFGCNHSDDSEAASSQSADVIANGLVPLLDSHGGTAETVATGRYLMPDGSLSRDPLGGPEPKCSVDATFRASGPATAVELADGTVVHPSEWMSLSGLPQASPDRDTRGYVDGSGRRVWLDVFPDISPP